MQIPIHKSETLKAIVASLFSLLVLSGTGYSLKSSILQITKCEQVSLNKSKGNQIAFYTNSVKYNNRILYKKNKILALLNFDNLVKVKINQLSRLLHSIETPSHILITLQQVPQPSNEDQFTSITG